MTTPETPFNRFSLDPSDFLATLALDYARESTREAPWYGVYGLMLKEFNTIDRDRKFATVVFPQLPVSMEAVYDDGNLLRQHHVWNSKNSDLQEEMDLDRFDRDISMPHLSGSPDPLVLGADGSPQQLQADQLESDEENDLDSFYKNMSAAEIRTFISTRIPDFSRKRFYLDETGKVTGCRTDLLVELKKQGLDPLYSMIQLNAAHKQVIQQAGHAFAEDKDLIALGYIIASGDLWKFGEVTRSECPIPFHRNRDPTYEPSSLSDSPDSQNTALSSLNSSLGLNDFHRSTNPSPLSESQKRFQSLSNPTLITASNISQRGQWFTDIKERLNQLDVHMSGAYK